MQQKRLVRDAGQAVLLVALAVVLTVMVAVGVVEVGSAMNDRQRAQVAADAAALAGAQGGRAGAADLAARNGAVLIRFQRSGFEVVVEVVVGRAHASARAGNGP